MTSSFYSVTQARLGALEIFKRQLHRPVASSLRLQFRGPHAPGPRGLAQLRSKIVSIHVLFSGTYEMELKGAIRLTTGRQYRDQVQDLLLND